MSTQGRLGYILMLANCGTLGASFVRTINEGLRIDYVIATLIIVVLMVIGLILLSNDPDVQEHGLVRWKPPKQRFVITGVALTIGGGTGVGLTALGWLVDSVSTGSLVTAGLMMALILVPGSLLLWFALSKPGAEQQK